MLRNRIFAVVVSCVFIVSLFVFPVSAKTVPDEVYPSLLLEVPRVTQSAMGCVVASFASGEAYLRGSYGGVDYRFGQDYGWQTPVYMLMIEQMNSWMEESGLVHESYNVPPDGWMELRDLSLENLYDQLLRGKPVVLWSDELVHASVLIGYNGPWDHLEESGFIVMDVLPGMDNDLSVLSDLNNESLVWNSCYRSLTYHLRGCKLSRIYVPRLASDRAKDPLMYASGVLDISENSALLWEKHSYFSCREVGFYIGTDPEQLRRVSFSSGNFSKGSFFDISESAGALLPGTCYSYQTYFVYDGKETRSPLQTFTTLGKAPVGLLGDANGDGRVDSADGALLARHLAKWNVSVRTDLCDFDKDGTLTSSEGAVLNRYLAKWSGLPYPVGQPIGG